MSLSLREAFSDKYITFVFYSSKHLHIDLETKQQQDWLAEDRFCKFLGNAQSNKLNMSYLAHLVVMWY